ncbi:MAG: MBL fold metallo-hydrolase [Bacilli bacterium]|nr:MBL fold metallo-hydrolase [Bacilli bacterium]
MKYLKINVFVFLFFCIFWSGCNKNKLLSDPVKISFIACGEADITLIQDKEYTVLIDTGEDTCSDVVIDYLEKNIKSIDLMILTHPDKDHIGNAQTIMKKWKVKEVYASNYLKHSELEAELLNYVSENNIKYTVLENSKDTVLGNLKLSIKPALKEYDSSNNSSLLTYVTVGKIRVFLGADIKKKRIEELLSQDIQKFHIVKLPYHGRFISNIEELLKKLNPEVVIVTSDQMDIQTRNLLEALKIEYAETLETIVIELDGVSWKRGV